MKKESEKAEVPEVIEEKYELAKIGPVEGLVRALAKKFDNVVYDVTTVKGMTVAKTARAELRKARSSLEDARKEEKADVLARGRYIDKRAKEILAEISKYEDPLDEQIKAEENRKENERLAKIEAERIRVETIQARITEIRNYTIVSSSRTSDEISALINGVVGISIDETYEEFQDVAQAAKEGTVSALEKLGIEAVAREEEQARIVAERAELARLRLLQEEHEREAAIKAKAEREAEEKRIAEERAKIEAERKAEEARMKKERDILEAQRKEEERRAMAERRLAEEKLAAENAEQQRRLREERENAEAERAKQEAVLKADREENERKRIAQEKWQAELDKQAREQAEQAGILSERRKKLAEARRDSHMQALADILELAENIVDHPNHREVRVEIALIAEASL